MSMFEQQAFQQSMPRRQRKVISVPPSISAGCTGLVGKGISLGSILMSDMGKYRTDRLKRGESLPPSGGRDEPEPRVYPQWSGVCVYGYTSTACIWRILAPGNRPMAFTLARSWPACAGVVPAYTAI